MPKISKKIIQRISCLTFIPILIVISMACSSSNPNPTSGASSTRTKGRILASNETGSAIYVLDLEQGAVETQTKSVSAAPEMIISPEGQYALIAQASGNRVDIMKMGTSVTVSAEEESSSGTDDHGHSHGKARFSGDHDHGSSSTEASSSESSDSSSSSSTSSVEQISVSITGEGLGHVVARGKWLAVQFTSKVVVIAEDNLESKVDSINESIVHNITTTLPGVPMDEEHIAVGNQVVEIEDGSVLHSGGSAAGNAILSSNILSVTRSGEGTALFGTDQGLLVVGKHTESGNTEWEDLVVSYPTPSETQIFLASDEHGHEEGEEEHEEGEDEHSEVIENRAATAWATKDGLGHAFAHLTHENHSAGVYLVEAEGLEEDSDLSKVFTYLEGTSSSESRPLAMSIVTLHGEEEEHSDEEEEEHSDTNYLLILMSDGSLRVHDASNEGAYIRTISSVIAPVTDLHPGENNLPGLTAGLGKVFVGDPSTNQIHQIDLSTFQTELTWSLGTSPNRLLLMGESTLSESSGESGHDHN